MGSHIDCPVRRVRDFEKYEGNMADACGLGLGLRVCRSKSRPDCRASALRPPGCCLLKTRGRAKRYAWAARSGV
jgi:hypothetical protein